MTLREPLMYHDLSHAQIWQMGPPQRDEPGVHTNTTVASGKRSQHYGKNHHVLLGKSTISMAISRG